MRTTKEAEINVALLQYIMKCRSAGDDEALAHLGLARQEAETVESLSWGDLEHLSSIHFPVLRGNAIDRDLFQRLRWTQGTPFCSSAFCKGTMHPGECVAGLSLLSPAKLPQGDLALDFSTRHTPR